MLEEILLARAVVVLSVVLLAALAFLFGHGVWLAVARRRTRSRLARGHAAMTRLVTTGEMDRAEVEAVRALPGYAQERLFAELARNFEGTFREQLRDVAVEVGALQRATARTRSRFWWRRVRGIRTLATLGAAEPLMLQLLRDRHPGVRAQVAEWAADHPSPAILRALLMMLSSSETLYRFVVQDAVLRAGPAAAEPLADFLASYRGAGTRPALEVAAIIAHPSFADPAIALCRDEDPDVRAAAAEVLGAVGGEAGVGILTELLTDPEGEVRCAAVSALARLGHWPAAAQIAPLLRDRVFKVRRAAGLALNALGSPGLLLLRRFQNDSDRFAADMARQVLDLPAVGAEGAR